MIEFPEDRLALVRDLLSSASREETIFERTHRIVAQSYKVVSCRYDVGTFIAAISHLFRGTPEDLRAVDLHDAVRLAGEIFREGELLHRHAVTVLSVEPTTPKRAGYIDYEIHHLMLLGGRALFLEILRALALPYAEQEGCRSFGEASCADVAMWMRPEVIAQGIEGRRHWSDWKLRHP